MKMAGRVIVESVTVVDQDLVISCPRFGDSDGELITTETALPLAAPSQHPTESGGSHFQYPHTGHTCTGTLGRLGSACTNSTSGTRGSIVQGNPLPQRHCRNLVSGRVKATMVRSDHRRLLVIGLTFVLLVLMRQSRRRRCSRPRTRSWYHAYVRWTFAVMACQRLTAMRAAVPLSRLHSPCCITCLPHLSSPVLRRESHHLALSTTLGSAIGRRGSQQDNKNMLIHGEAERWPCANSAGCSHHTAGFARVLAY